MELGSGAFGRQLGLRWGHEDGVLMNGVSVLLRIIRTLLPHSICLCEDITRNSILCPRRGLSSELDHTGPWSWTFSLQTMKNVSVVDKLLSLYYTVIAAILRHLKITYVAMGLQNWQAFVDTLVVIVISWSPSNQRSNCMCESHLSFR